MTAPRSTPRYSNWALIIIALALLSAALTAPFFFAKYQTVDGKRFYLMIHTHDMAVHLKMMDQFDRSLRSGLLEPRWFSEVNNGYGSATLNFYPRVFYYLTSLTNLAAHDWSKSLFIISIVALASSGLSFYWLSRLFYGPASSSIASLAYMLMPYHQIDLYWRGAVPEYIGFALLPLILRFAIKVATEPSPRYYAALAFFYGVHLMTHMPVGLMFSYAMVLFAVTWSVKTRDPKITFRIGTGMALGVVFSATYWLPALLEAPYIYEPTSGIFPYHQLYLQPAIPANRFDGLIYSSFKFIALLILASALVLRAKRAASSEVNVGEQKLWVHLWLILGSAALLLCTALSYDVSKLLPKIQAAVPPFRWLSIATMFACLLLAASVDRIRAERPGLIRILALAIALALNLWLNFSGVIAGSMANSPEFVSQDLIDSGFIPAGAKMPQDLPDTPKVEVGTAGGGSSEILIWEPERRRVRVQVGQAATVRLKTYNFRGWTATVDGAPAALTGDSDGIQSVEVPAGTHTIETRFRNTWPRTAGQILSLLGAAAMLALAVYPQARRVDETAVQTPRARIQRLVESKGFLAVLGVITLAVLGLLLVANLSRRSSHTPGSGGAETSRDYSETQPGLVSDATLFIPGVQTISVAADEHTLNQLIDALSHHDTGGLESLSQSGKVLSVDNRTRVRVLERSSGKIRIRITEGRYQWAEGWALEAWLR